MLLRRLSLPSADIGSLLILRSPLTSSCHQNSSSSARSPLPAVRSIQWHLIFAPAYTLSSVVNPGELTPEAYIDNAADIVGFGYGESKWIGETLLRRAGEATPMKPVCVRVGQLSGGSNGNWNANDWVPTIVRTSKALGAAPDVPGVRHFLVSSLKPC